MQEHLGKKHAPSASPMKLDGVTERFDSARGRGGEESFHGHSLGLNVAEQSRILEAGHRGSGAMKIRQRATGLAELTENACP
jgi:hypothetical protein